MRIAAGDQVRTPGRHTKIWNRAFVSVFLTNMTMNLGQTMTVALVAKYADHLGASAIVVGLVTGMFASTALIFKLLSGPAIDTYNRKFLLMAALLVMGLSFFGYSFFAHGPHADGV